VALRAEQRAQAGLADDGEDTELALATLHEDE